MVGIMIFARRYTRARECSTCAINSTFARAVINQPTTWACPVLADAMRGLHPSCDAKRSAERILRHGGTEGGEGHSSCQ